MLGKSGVWWYTDSVSQFRRFRYGFLRLLAAGRCGALDTFFSGLTYFGSEIAFMAAALLIFWCVDKRQGYYVFLVGALGTVCNQFLKLAFRIPRPWVLDPDFQIVEAARADATGYSFLRPHAEYRRHDGLDLREPEGNVGAYCLYRVDGSGAVFADVPGRSHAAGRRRGLPDGAGAGCGALSGVPDRICRKKTVPWLLLGVAVLCGGYLIYASSLARCDWPEGSEDLSISRTASKTRTPCWARCWAF